MKKPVILFSVAILLLITSANSEGQVTNPGTVVQTNASNQANNNVNNSVNGGLNSVTNGLKGMFKKKKKMTHADSVQMQQQQAAAQPSNPNTASQAQANTTQGSFQSLASYQNYDFIPGNNILFEDEFTDDQSGEFPTHWDLKKGQAILNTVGSDKAFFITDGNYANVVPLMKNSSYLTQNFSIEYDVYANGGYPAIVEMDDPNQTGFLAVSVGRGGVDWKGYGPGDHTVTFSAALPADLAGDNFNNKWHHVAIAFKNNQMKVYVDKYRVLLVPRCNGLPPASVLVEGIGSQEKPIIFKNFKIADGAQMYMTGQKFTDAKIVTHGINFDIDKASIKPESMGTLNMVVQVMKDNPDIKFEVDGHTDNTGTPAHNQVLSQQRAGAVMAQLIVMGVDPARLTSKGFGDTKPMADNTSLEGKANNRRVEFVKQ